MGRIPFVVPVRWENNWPVLGVDGKVPTVVNIPSSQMGALGFVVSNEFDRAQSEPPLPPAWQWNHNPDDCYWSLSARPGCLRSSTGGIDQGFLRARNSLTQRTFGPECSGVISMDASSMQDGGFAGLGGLQQKFGLFGVKTSRNIRAIVMVSA